MMREKFAQTTNRVY
jgi:FtsH-binding integral membrane protein